MCNLRIKAETDSFSTKEYGTYGWPITYFDSAQNLNEKDNCATINLRIDDNTKPILFFENTKLLGKNNHSRFWDEKQLLNGTATDWSNDITLRFPNTGSDRNNVAYYIKLQYFRQEYNPLSPNTVLKNEQYFDSAFCPIDLLNTSNDNNVFQQVHNPSMHYVRGRMPNYTKEFGYFAQNGAYWDKDRVLFYSQIIFPHKTTGHFYSKEKGIDNKFSLESNFFNISFLKKDVNISCSILQEKKGVNQYEPFKIISVSHYNGLFGAKENLLLLGLTVEELQSLKDAANAIDPYTHSPRLSDLYRQYVFLEEIPSSPETDKDGILFRKFMLKIQGYTSEGVVSFVETNKKIYVYSRDGLCFTSIGFTDHERVSTLKIARKGDKGRAIQEINLRLAGFGGVLPRYEYTDETIMAVKQFQRDYMNMSSPTGEVDSATMEKIDEFSKKYRENVNNYKCKCKKCGGFGQGRYRGEYISSHSEKFYKYEYPGMHQSLLWAVSASRFYLTKKLDGVYSINTIYSGYRCWNAIEINKPTTNHLGKAVDIHFNKNGQRIRTDMDLIREKIYCECIGAPFADGKFGWRTNQFGLEPYTFSNGTAGARTWVHLDVREFDHNEFLKDEFFIKSNDDSCFSKELTEINN